MKEPVPFLCIDTQRGRVRRYIKPAQCAVRMTNEAILLHWSPHMAIPAVALEQFRVNPEATYAGAEAA